ncbi:Sec-independent protein translocase protein TatB [Halomonas sp. E19]|uniref:Sec-independent protein translocase protein TatB n=1 Tax=unclassified Halomonas TaxID=2609666 RepID=UPI0040346888
MFDIGFLELLILGIVGLLVLGPERLPKAARTLGLWVGKIKRTVSSMQREINAQLETEELRQKLKEQQAKLDESLERAKRDVESIAKPYTTSTPRRGDHDSSPGDKGGAADAPPRSASARLDDALAGVRKPVDPAPPPAGQSTDGSASDGNAPTGNAPNDKDAASR